MMKKHCDAVEKIINGLIFDANNLKLERSQWKAWSESYTSLATSCMAYFTRMACNPC